MSAHVTERTRRGSKLRIGRFTLLRKDGNSITAGTQAGTFTCSYSGSTSSYDITNFLNNNSEAGTLYIAVENEATADIGVSTIYIKATVIP